MFISAMWMTPPDPIAKTMRWLTLVQEECFACPHIAMGILEKDFILNSVNFM